MVGAPLPENEAERLAALRRTKLLDTDPEEVFDRITRLASRLFDVPMALITLLDERRQWFKSRVGIEVGETPREHSICGYAILQRDVFVVEDTLLDPRFADSPLIVGPPHVRFYAGAPLTAGEAGALGTLCVISPEPRAVSDHERQCLADLAELVMASIERRLDAIELERRVSALTLAEEIGEVGHWRMDLHTQEIEWSRQLYRIHGLDPGGERPTLERGLELYHPEDAQWLRDYMAEQFGEPLRRTFRVVRPDGEIRHVEFVSQREGDAESPRALFGVLRDVTERHELDAQLRATQRLASLGTLSASIAHEINNPLSYILVGAERLERALVDHPELADITDIPAEIRDGADRIRRVVKGLETFSGGGSDVRESVDLEHVIDDAIALCMNALRQRARLVRERAVDTPEVLAAANELVTVVVNLVLNAADAISLGDPAHHTIRVSTGATADGSALIEVEDSGHGMTDEVQRRAFEPFFTTKSEPESTGLGLATCHGIVKAHGGEIEILSRLGEGTVVRVILPSARVAAMKTPSRSPGVTIAPPAKSERARVLVIDDDLLVGRAIRRQLDSHDVEVETDPQRALERLVGGDDFDVVFCDLMMPTLDGAELHAELSRARPELADRIVVITGGAFTEQARAFLTQTQLRVLHKPVETSILEAALAEVMGAA